MPFRVFQSTDYNAPQQTLAGSDDDHFLAILDAVLVDGYSDQTVTIAHVSGVATITCTSDHGLFDGFILNNRVQYTISGAAEAAYNGTHECDIVSGTTLTFSVDAATASPATGTITGGQGSANWTREFANATGKRAFRMPTATSNGKFFRFDAITNYKLHVLGYDTMSDIDTGTNEFGKNSSSIPCMYFSNVTSGVKNRDWVIYVSDNSIIINVHNAGTTDLTDYHVATGFIGDLESYNASDTDNTVIILDNNTSSAPAGKLFAKAASMTSEDLSSRIAKGWDGVVLNSPLALVSNTNLKSNNAATTLGIRYGNTYDPRLLFVDISVCDDQVLRGTLKDLVSCVNQHKFVDGAVFNGTGADAGNRYVCMMGGDIKASNPYQLFVRI